MGAREEGQILPLVALVIVLAGLACVAAGKLGGKAVGQARAATAADAAALAGAAAGREAAAAAAAANGGRVTNMEGRGADTRVVVMLPGGASASARARRTGGGGGGPAPALRAALARAAQLVGTPVPTVPPPPGGHGPGDAATRHERGLAVDVPPSFVATLAPVASGAGLCRPYPDDHPVHFEVCPFRLP